MPHQIYRNASGNRLKSVTSILSVWGDKNGLAYAANKLGLDGKFHKDAWGKLAQLGTTVHAVCSATLKGKSMDDTVEWFAQTVPHELVDQFQNCCSAWVQCQREVRFGKPLAIERPMISEQYQYAGSPDVCIAIGEPAILDFKTGNTYPEHVIQLAAYRQLWNEQPEAKKARARCGYLVQLNRDTGGYQLKCVPEATMEAAWRVFLDIKSAYEGAALLKKAV